MPDIANIYTKIYMREEFYYIELIYIYVYN